MSLGIVVFACDDATLASCTHIISGAGTVIAGEHIAYQATLALPSGNCAFGGGTFTIQTPDGSATSVATGGTCQPGAVGCDLSTACIGCTVAQTGGSGNFTTIATSYVSPKVPYLVSAANFVPAGCTPGVNCAIAAKTTYGGTGIFGDGVAFTGSSPSFGPQASPSTPDPAVGCSATVDKQVSCDGGSTFQDVSGTGNDDPSGSSRLGCVAAFGQPVTQRFIAKNTGGASIQCTLTDNVISIPAGSQAVSLATLNSTTGNIDVNIPQCNLTGSQSGDNTATLGSCTCMTAEGVTVPGTGGTDDATYACCGVKVDKQISCDNSTWTDVGLATNNEGGTNGCVGKVGETDIRARWFAANLGNTDVTCTLTDTNATFNVSALSVGTITAGTGDPESTPIHGPTAAQECSTAHAGETPNDQDTATLNCTCVAPTGDTNKAGPQTATDSATFECCGIQVDKQVSCNGGAFVDPGFTQACGATPAGCTALNGQAVAISYQIKNVGTIAVDTCTVTDANSGGTFQAAVAAGASISIGGVGPVVNNTTNPGTCSTTFSANEPNHADASCTCTGGALGTPTVTAESCNKITCTGNPMYTLSKSCTPQATAGNYDIVATITNTDNGGSTLSCTLTDNVFAGACPPAAGAQPIGTVTLSPSPVDVAASPANCDKTTGANCTQATASGTLTGQTQATCDQVTADCTSTAGTVTQAPAATAVCPFGSCFTRTPGYWGTHPNQTQAVISSVGGSLPVCGIGVTNVGLGVNSAIQNICESAGDAKKGKGNSFYTSTQQLQLIRQCTAAALNLAATGLGNTVTGEQSCEGVSPGITSDFNRCCGTGADSCNAGLKGTDIDVTGCIGILDTFNNKFDNVNFPSIYPNEAANSSTCSAATGDGLTNCSSDSLGGGINCGKP